MIRDLDGIATFAARKALFGRVPMEAILLNCTSEQMPNPESRIGLGRERDAFGLRKVTIDWRLTAEDKRGMAIGHRMFGAELGRAGFGRVPIDCIPDEINWPKDMYGDEHNIGTTRMHRDANLGCRRRELPRSRRIKPICGRQFGVPDQRRVQSNLDDCCIGVAISGSHQGTPPMNDQPRRLDRRFVNMFLADAIAWAVSGTIPLLVSKKNNLISRIPAALASVNIREFPWRTCAGHGLLEIIA